VLRSIKASNSLDGVVDELVPLKDYYELVGLSAMLEREESYDLLGADLVARRAGGS